MDKLAEKTGAKGRRGRPRSLDLDRLVEAALEMGLSNLDMDALAAQLGVGAGTIYGYVRSRDELVTLAVDKIFRQRLVSDTGQCWQDAVREMAKASFDAFISDRAMLSEFIKGTYSSIIGDAYQAAMVDLLCERGLRRETALALYFEVGQAVVGAALGQLHRIANAHAEANFPDVIGDYSLTLERIIAGYEAEL